MKNKRALRRKNETTRGLDLLMRKELGRLELLFYSYRKCSADIDV